MFNGSGWNEWNSELIVDRWDTSTPYLITRSPCFSLCETSNREAGKMPSGNQHKLRTQTDLGGKFWHIDLTGLYLWASDLAFSNLRTLICKMSIKIAKQVSHWFDRIAQEKGLAQSLTQRSTPEMSAIVIWSEHQNPSESLRS